MIRNLAKRIPGVRRVLKQIRRPPQFINSQSYWEQRYVRGGNSGSGSYGQHAEFKADVINTFVRDNNIQDVVEFGCGDGNQLQLADYKQYVGVDVSLTAVTLCRKTFAADTSKTFYTAEEFSALASTTSPRFDLVLSLDVIYHLVEDSVFEAYMRNLFTCSDRFVVIYSSNTEARTAEHVRHRRFTDWIDANLPQWKLTSKRANDLPLDAATGVGSLSDFYFFAKSA